MKDNKEKNNELFNQATELIKQLIMRNEHMYKDIAKKKKIIIYKNKTIKTINNINININIINTINNKNNKQ